MCGQVWCPILRICALQWAAIFAAAPGEQLGVQCLAQGSHLSHGTEGGREPYTHCRVKPLWGPGLMYVF